jgi:hypothetical protein
MRLVLLLAAVKLSPNTPSENAELNETIEQLRRDVQLELQSVSVSDGLQACMTLPPFCCRDLPGLHPRIDHRGMGGFQNTAIDQPLAPLEHYRKSVHAPSLEFRRRVSDCYSRRQKAL